MGKQTSYNFMRFNHLLTLFALLNVLLSKEPEQISIFIQGSPHLLFPFILINASYKREKSFFPKCLGNEIKEGGI